MICAASLALNMGTSGARPIPCSLAIPRDSLIPAMKRFPIGPPSVTAPHSVITPSGQTAVAWIFEPAISARREAVKPITACLAETYALLNGKPIVPATLATLMICPDPFDFICFNAGADIYQSENTFTPNMLCNCSGVVSSTEARFPRPALLMRISIPPK